MRRAPTVTFTRANGESHMIVYGTFRRASRDAALASRTFPDIEATWVEVPTLWDKLRRQKRTAKSSPNEEQ